MPLIAILKHIRNHIRLNEEFYRILVCKNPHKNA
jgi:hypothetical protein